MDRVRVAGPPPRRADRQIVFKLLFRNVSGDGRSRPAGYPSVAGRNKPSHDESELAPAARRSSPDCLSDSCFN